ncbi:prolyl-tRNA synthetase, partial [Lecanoromycetidae sp. Uapishka_2]
MWTPTGGIALMDGEKEDSHALLIRAGYIRQAHSGLFQFLPLGLRVQEKIERLLDRHMVKLGASKLSLSTFSTEDLWSKTGRLESSKSELFRLEDRKGGKYLLSPTHEEEITSLVGGVLNSYKELPLRLYQISRKYRDEPRPRQGLLRTREFLMKDLYTFDATTEDALKTYQTVRQAYAEFFDELKVPYLTAEASAGEIGGDLSHEYHISTPKGEDRIISCDSCDYVANEELAESKINREMREPESKVHETSSVMGLDSAADVSDDDLRAQSRSNQWFGVTKDRSTLLQIFLPNEVSVSKSNGIRGRKPEINPYMIKKICPQLDLSVEHPLMAWNEHHRAIRDSGKEKLTKPQLLRFLDIRYRLSESSRKLLDLPNVLTHNKPMAERTHESITSNWYPAQLDLVRIGNGDDCSRCSEGKLKVQTAIELGHTFHLGTRYSRPLNATVLPQSMSKNPSQVPVHMGCHGIGISRLIAAVADLLTDPKGLNWPRLIAPFEAVVVPTKGQEEGAEEVFDILTEKNHLSSPGALDAIVDDRKKEFGWKLNDADLIGYPIIVVVGRHWRERGECEVQCRRLGVKRNIPARELRIEIEGMLDQL